MFINFLYLLAKYAWQGVNQQDALGKPYLGRHLSTSLDATSFLFCLHSIGTLTIYCPAAEADLDHLPSILISDSRL